MLATNKPTCTQTNSEGVVKKENALVTLSPFFWSNSEGQAIPITGKGMTEGDMCTSRLPTQKKRDTICHAKTIQPVPP